MRNQEHKVVFFSALPPFRGGIADFSELLVLAMEKDCDINAFTFKSQYPKLLFPGKTQLKTNKGQKSYPRIVSGFNPFTYLHATKQLKQSSPTIFITNYWMTFFAPMNIFFSKFLNKNCIKIAIIHNLIPHEKRFFDSFFNLFFLRSFDGFVVMSDTVKNQLLSMKPEAKLCFLKHPAYNQFGEKIKRELATTSIGLDPTKKILLFFGLIREYKGLDLLIRAFSSLDESYSLVIAGEIYGNENTYTDFIKDSKNQNILFFNKYIDDQDVKLYFSAADLCILPYKSATQSGIQAIANSFNLPVLISNVGGLADEIIDFKNGFVLDNLNPENITKKIENIFTLGLLSKVRQNLSTANYKKTTTWTDFSQSVLEFAKHLKN